MTVPSAAAVWLGCSMFYGVRRTDAAHDGSNEHPGNLVRGPEHPRTGVSKALQQVEPGDLNDVPVTPVHSMPPRRSLRSSCCSSLARKWTMPSAVLRSFSSRTRSGSTRRRTCCGPSLIGRTRW
ncbi:hypothetical protein ACFV19_06885 [Streptomyces griseoluteus]|uniref:hypothetical protein n=1 Tax=Streptomyces griseoluteus TaxID=29306 RepID=UPI0036790DC0